MGIKGRRRKLRRREELERHEGAADSDESHDDPLDGELALELIPARPKMKHSEMFNAMDMDFLEQLRDEHNSRRKQPTGGKRQRADMVAPAPLEPTARTQDAFGGDITTGSASVQPQQQSTITEGAPFSHPSVGIDPRLVDALAMSGFTAMTKVQLRAIPLALQGYDILGQAKTGSGKTLAFCVPILSGSLATLATTPTAFVALVLSPTKELCVQIATVLRRLADHLATATALRTEKDAQIRKPSSSVFRSELITGGTKVREERQRLLVCNAAVGTPGRVLDHVKHTSQWTIRTSTMFFVMDEADRLLADGFQRDIDAIIEALPSQRQTFLFSATNSKSIRELARLSLGHSALFVSTKGDAPQPLDGSTDSCVPYIEIPEARDGGLVAGDEELIPSALVQYCRIVPTHERLRTLYDFVKRVGKTRKAMIFCSTVASAQFSCLMMGAAGFHDDVLMLHGKMKHRQRLATFEAFQRWESGVLFCTDVAARGLDIPKVDWILQYDAPTDPTEYIHRIGRTARAGATGNALLFVAPEEQGFVSYLKKHGISMQVLPQEPVPDVQHAFHRILEIDPIVAKHAQAAFRAHVAAYQSHVLRSIFDPTKINLDDLAISFALQTVPSVSLPRRSSSTPDEKKEEYVKGKLRSIRRRANLARAEYERLKTKTQWTDDGVFVGMRRTAPN